jgi:hypothetical protein
MSLSVWRRILVFGSVIISRARLLSLAPPHPPNPPPLPVALEFTAVALVWFFSQKRVRL